MLETLPFMNQRVTRKALQRWLPALFLFEFRHSLSWSWLLPPLLVLASFGVTRFTYLPETLIGAPKYPEYALHLREDLELFLPLVAFFLTNQLLAQEWQRGTIPQLALRKPLFMLGALRYLYVFLFLSLCVTGGTLISITITAQHPNPDSNTWQWVGETLLTCLPNSLALSVFCQLLLLLLINSITGYIIGTSIWLLNLAAVPLLIRNNTNVDILIYSLNGWTQSMATTIPDDWWKGKLVFLALALLFLMLQQPILRYEARFIQSTEE